MTDALTIPDPIIEGEAIIPLSVDEECRLDELETQYNDIEDIEKDIPFVKGKILNEILTKRLYRAHYTSFGEYALARFGVSREYAHRLAQISGIPELVAETIETGTQFNISVDAASALMSDSNKIAKSLGVGKVEYKAIEPIIKSALAVMVSVAPKNESGEVELTPKFVASFNKALSDHVTEGVVTIDGQQMTAEAAREKGLLNHALQTEVLEAAAEQIRSNAVLIRSEREENRRRQQTSITNGGVSYAPDVYAGPIPKLDCVCSVHGNTEISEIGLGKLLTQCGCRWHIDATTSTLTAYEVESKRIR